MVERIFRITEPGVLIKILEEIYLAQIGDEPMSINSSKEFMMKLKPRKAMFSLESAPLEFGNQDIRKGSKDRRNMMSCLLMQNYG